jgi:hypothetical protein
MKIEYTDFIGFYRDVYPEGYCQHLIEQFNILQEDGVGSNRQNSERVLKHIKDDYQICLNLREQNIRNFKHQNEEHNAVSVFFNGLQRCFDDYVNVFSIIKDSSINASTMKMQKTGPGGGYHVWHQENEPGEHSRRVLVYSLYLNTLSENAGGETEFLYQKLRVKPEENLMIIWPAAFTHTHRGNIVLTDEYKYIVTGWFYYN